ncbi:hypothetical protein, partial [Bradyrhizobium sp.]|uniref:hypothetical protein n=1 Tax=Bradyrhizobium sp. TaxID=376 RepID=UPI0023924524
MYANPQLPAKWEIDPAVCPRYWNNPATCGWDRGKKRKELRLVFPLKAGKKRSGRFPQEADKK